MTNPYPTEWEYATEHGCGRKCRNKARRMEQRELAPDKTELRHVWPVEGVSGLQDALAQAGYTFRTGVVGGGSTWYALTPRNGGRPAPASTEPVPTKARAFGSSQRQALQNLADQLGVKYGARCGR